MQVRAAFHGPLLAQLSSASMSASMPTQRFGRQRAGCARYLPRSELAPSLRYAADNYECGTVPLDVAMHKIGAMGKTLNRAD